MALLGGKLALITGASSGIGRAIALQYGREGGDVCLLGRDSARLRYTAKEIGEQRAQYHSVDLAQPDEVDSFLEWFTSRVSRLDALVHSAALYAAGDLEHRSRSEFESLFSVNVRSVWQLTQRLLPLLRTASGEIVFVNSSVIRNPSVNTSIYSMTKSALKTLADSLRAEVNGDDIRVLSVIVGRTATPMQQRIAAAEGKPYRPERLLQPQDVASAVLGAIALPRTAEVTDIYLRPMQKA
jgi:NADP-dependent 3-hydroxy acid dehydrogenase YdfG